MARFDVQRRYSATRDGRRFGPWTEGDRVELDEADAAWVERDSPGCLVPTGAPEQAPSAARAKPPGPDRQHRGGRNRSGS